MTVVVTVVTFGVGVVPPVGSRWLLLEEKKLLVAGAELEDRSPLLYGKTLLEGSP